MQPSSKKVTSLSPVIRAHKPEDADSSSSSSTSIQDSPSRYFDVQVDSQKSHITATNSILSLPNVEKSTVQSLSRPLSSLENTSTASVSANLISTTNENFTETLIPADGDCLYTSIFVGYLLPVIENIEQFKTRLLKLIGANLDHPEHLQNFILKGLENVNFLRTDEFKVLIKQFREKMELNNGLWGGPEEIKELSQKLNIIIQELLPSLESSSQEKRYIESDKTPPSSDRSLSDVETIFILRTNPIDKEAIEMSKDDSLQLAQLESARVSNTNQHFRLISVSLPKQTKAAADAELPRKDKNEETKPLNEQIKAKYKALGGEHWRVYIDAMHLPEKKGISRRQAYDEGTHGGNAEPGYYRNMKAANRKIFETLGTPLTLDFYVEIHKLAMAHSQGKSGRIREGSAPITLLFKDKFAGVEEEAKKYLIFGKPSDNGQYQITHTILKVKDIEESFNDIMSNYCLGIQTANTIEEKLFIVAKTHLYLEWLHVFNDGNSRVNKLILNKFLAENELDLCILDTPLGVEHKNLEMWIASIQEGQERWRQLVEKISANDRSAYELKQKKNKKDKQDAISMGHTLSDSDTSSGEEEDNSEKILIGNAKRKLLEGNFKDALIDLDTANVNSFDADEIIFNTVFPEIKEDKNKNILRELIIYFMQKRGAKEYNKGPQLHHWTAKCFYKFYFQDPNDKALETCLKHLDIALKNRGKPITSELREFVDKIKYKIPAQLKSILAKTGAKELLELKKYMN